MKVLVTDTCNLAGVIGVPFAAVVTVRQKGPTAWERLLLYHRGCVDLSATSPGQPAWCSQATGGWFTHTLRQTATAWWGFELTDRSVAALREAGVPRGPLRKLNDLKGKKFDTEAEFLGRLAKLLTREEAERFQHLVLDHALAYPGWQTFVNKLSGDANDFFLRRRKAIIDDPRGMPPGTLKQLKAQAGMKPPASRPRDRTARRAGSQGRSQEGTPAGGAVQADSRGEGSSAAPQALRVGWADPEGETAA
jgi:hypothetical protein